MNTRSSRGALLPPLDTFSKKGRKKAPLAMEDSQGNTAQLVPPAAGTSSGGQAGPSQPPSTEGQPPTYVTTDVLDKKLEALFDKISAKLPGGSSAIAQGTAEALNRITNVKKLISNGPVDFSPAQMASLPSRISVGMEGVPVLVLPEVAAYRDLQAAGLSLGQSGGSASLKHELPILFTRMAVGGLLRDLMDTLYKNQSGLDASTLWRIMGPGGPIEYLQTWLLELDAARFESIRTYVCDGPLFSATYDCMRFAPHYRGGNDVAKDKLRVKHAEAMAAALDKSIKQATKDGVASKTPAASTAPFKPTYKGMPGAGRGKGKHPTADSGAAGDA